MGENSIELRHRRNLQQLHNFLNPARDGMSMGEYNQLKAERSRQWSNFVRNSR